MKIVGSLWSALTKAVFCLPLCALLFALCSVGYAQQPARVPRIGFLGATSLSGESARIEAFRQRLRELGYVEDKNIVIEYRWAEGKFDRLPAIAAELARVKVDVIVTGGATSTRAAKEVTTATPIVMAQVHDPVGTGFVASLARPGGNITGLSTLAPEISGKRLELLKEIIPRLSRVAVLGTSTDNPGNEQALKKRKLPQRHTGYRYSTWTCPVRMILRLPSERQSTPALIHSFCWGVPCSKRTGDGSWNSH